MAKSLLRLALPALLLAAMAGPAAAAMGHITASAKVRLGPGADYGVVARLQAGDPVDVVSCRKGWCFVAVDDCEGWVQVRHVNLRRVAAEQPWHKRPYPQVWTHEPWPYPAPRLYPLLPIGF